MFWAGFAVGAVTLFLVGAIGTALLFWGWVNKQDDEEGP